LLRSPRASLKILKNGDEREMSAEKVNVGIVLSTTLEKWRIVEAFLAKNAEIVYVKKVPPAVRLRIRQEFERDEGEEENGRRFSSTESTK
jgi:hypothetical protein